MNSLQSNPANKYTLVYKQTFETFVENAPEKLFTTAEVFIDADDTLS